MAGYTNLRPGTYRFTVQAAGRDGRWTEPGKSFDFTIAPFLWETPWFTGAWVATAAALLLFGMRWRVREVRRVHLLEADAIVAGQRESIARDLHDDLGSRLAQISLLGELAARDPAQASRIPALARDVAQGLDALVWTVHPGRDALNHLADYLSQFAREFITPSGLELELDFPTVVPAMPLSASIRKAVLLATREALRNVVRHAAARHVRVAFELGAAAFSVVVEDDGQGFANLLPIADPEAAQRGLAQRRGHGLDNMRRRLEEIGGRAEFGSRPGGGARVRLSVPLPTHSS